MVPCVSPQQTNAELPIGLNMDWSLVISISSLSDSVSVRQVLSLANNELSSLPASLSNLTRLRKLNLSHNHIVHIPSCVYHMRALVWDMALSLGEHWTGHQPISATVTSLMFLIHLIQVFLHLACNHLENLAENIQSLVELKILIVEGNSIHSLPKALCCLTR